MNIEVQYVQQPPVPTENVFFSVIAPDVYTVNENRKEEAVLEKGYTYKIP